MDDDISTSGDDHSATSSVTSEFSTGSQLVRHLHKKRDTIARNAKRIFREAKAIFKEKMKECAELSRQADVTAAMYDSIPANANTIRTQKKEMPDHVQNATATTPSTLTPTSPPVVQLCLENNNLYK